MASYSIEWKRSAYHDLKKIDKQHIPRILKEIRSLSLDPRPPDCEKLVDTERTFRVRIGDYRIVYQLDDRNRIVLIDCIRHRKDVYRKR
jgi:mRNA interferase RelE/StbE